jgi:hypothetical protein
MMQFATPLLPLPKMLAFTWDENSYVCFLQSCSIPFVDESTLCSPKMAFVPWLVLSLPTQCKRIYFLDLVQLKDLMPSMWLKPKK